MSISDISFARLRLERFLLSPIAERFIAILIVLNALTLGLSTYDDFLRTSEVSLGLPLKTWFEWFDWFVVIVFSLEIFLRIIALGRRFGEDKWDVFDVIVVLVSLIGQSPVFSAVRVLRVLRVLRLLSHFHSLRLISFVIWKSITGCFSISLLMLLVLFVFAIIGHELFGVTHPQIFGNLHLAMHTLFRVAALYAYDDVVGLLVVSYPSVVYLYMIPYFIIMSYVIINFFSAIVLYYLYEFTFDDIKGTKKSDEETPEEDEATPQMADPLGISIAQLTAEIRHLREEIQTLKGKAL